MSPQENKKKEPPKFLTAIKKGLGKTGEKVGKFFKTIDDARDKFFTDLYNKQQEKKRLRRLEDPIYVELVKKIEELEGKVSEIKDDTSKINEQLEGLVRAIPPNIKKIIDEAENLNLEEKFKIMQKKIMEEITAVPEANKDKRKRLSKHDTQIKYILDKIKLIKTKLRPELEKIFGTEFKNDGLLLIALCRPNIKQSIISLRDHFRSKSIKALETEEFESLILTQDVSEVLAHLGDKVLDLSTIHLLWESTKDKVGSISQERSKIVSNDNLAKFSEQWGLWEHRLNKFDDKLEEKYNERNLIHEKGTLVEALVGIIYMEYGQTKTDKIIPLLLNKNEKSRKINNLC